MNPRVAVVRFGRHPERMLRALREKRATAADLQEAGDHYRLLDGRQPAVRIRRVGRRIGGLLAACQAGALPASANTPRLERLRRLGLLEPESSTF